MIIIYFVLSLWFLKCVTSKFNPYVDNGGTVVGLAGKDYVLFAADTRLKNQYAIHTRNITRLFEIDDGLLFSGSKCWTDVLALSKELKNAAMVYEWEHRMKLAIRPFSYLIASELYKRRFFPYYTFAMVAGIDTEGTGAIYKYDAVGSTERVTAVCSGEGEELIQPILDELTNMEEDDRLWQIAPNGENAFVSSTLRTSPDRATNGVGVVDEHPQKLRCVGLNEKEACEAVLRAFRAAAEREITVGDGVDIWVMKRNPLSKDRFGVPYADTNAYLLEKYHYPLPSH